MNEITIKFKNHEQLQAFFEFMVENEDELRDTAGMMADMKDAYIRHIHYDYENKLIDIN